MTLQLAASLKDGFHRVWARRWRYHDNQAPPHYEPSRGLLLFCVLRFFSVSFLRRQRIAQRGGELTFPSPAVVQDRCNLPELSGLQGTSEKQSGEGTLRRGVMYMRELLPEISRDLRHMLQGMIYIRKMRDMSGLSSLPRELPFRLDAHRPRESSRFRSPRRRASPAARR